MTPLNLTVVRRWFTPNESIGKLYVEGKFFCYTLEDEIRPEGEKVPGETAIPYGTYSVEITYSPKFGKPMPLIENVPGFSGIRIHTGNDDDDTAGCLLVGFGRTETTITQSTPAFKELYSIIERAQQEGRPVKISFYTLEKRVLYVAGLTILALFILFLIYNAIMYYVNESRSIFS